MSLSALHYSGLALGLVLASTVASGDKFDVTVPMHGKGLATYYVHAEIGDLGSSEFMVDTGSGYLTINEQTLNALQGREQVHYVKELRAILANGSEMIIPVYAIKQLRIGTCTLRNVEAAVFPARTRQILGLSALNKAAPFTFSVEPPELILSNCSQSVEASLTQPVLAEAAEPAVLSGSSGAAPASPVTPLTN